MRNANGSKPGLVRRVLAVLAMICAPLVVVAVTAPPAQADTLGYPNANAAACGSDWCVSGNPISSRGYYYKNCTDYVAWKLQSLGVPDAKTRGLHWGGAWADNASQNGLTWSTTPKAGTAAVKPGNPGHVAFVESVNADGTITVSEYNYDWGGTGRYWTGNPASRGFTKYVDFGVNMTPPSPSPSDGDGDGVADSSDILPAVPGTVANRGAPVGSSRISGDFNGDGNQDVAVFYDYTAGSLKIWLFAGNGDGSFAAPVVIWDSGPGNWWGSQIKPIVGDFNGDGLDDIATLYGYAGGTTKLWLFTGTASGINAPVLTWDSGPNNWWWERIKQMPGDFNGDGLDDIAVFYDYTGGRSAIWLFYGMATGFAAPQMKWDSGPNSWGWQAIDPVVGDFDNDGKSDIAAFYDYGGGTTKLWLFTGTVTGINAPALKWDSGSGNWRWDSSKPLAGDFNGDGNQDVAALYGYAGGTTKLWLFAGSGNGSLAAPQMKWDSGPNSWWWSQIMPLAGDFDNDGKSDIAAFYKYTGGLLKIWSFGGSATGFAAPQMKWDSGPGNWWGDQVILP